jgi:hypothetical protein
MLLGWVCGDLAPLESDLEERLRAARLRAGTATGMRKWWQDRVLARG